VIAADFSVVPSVWSVSGQKGGNHRQKLNFWEKKKKTDFSGIRPLNQSGLPAEWPFAGVLEAPRCAQARGFLAFSFEPSAWGELFTKKKKKTGKKTFPPKKKFISGRFFRFAQFGRNFYFRPKKRCLSPARGLQMQRQAPGPVYGKGQHRFFGEIKLPNGQNSRILGDNGNPKPPLLAAIWAWSLRLGGQ